MNPTIDASQTIEALGLEQPPRIDWDRSFRLLHNAEYQPGPNSVRIHPTLFHDWAATGMAEALRIRNPINGLRFVVAHELAHALQEQRDPELFLPWGDYARELDRERQAIRPAMTIAEKARLHRRVNKYEAEADRIARQLWRTVKVTA